MVDNKFSFSNKSNIPEEWLELRAQSVVQVCSVRHIPPVVTVTLLDDEKHHHLPPHSPDLPGCLLRLRVWGFLSSYNLFRDSIIEIYSEFVPGKFEAKNRTFQVKIILRFWKRWCLKLNGLEIAKLTRLCFVREILILRYTSTVPPMTSTNPYSFLFLSQPSTSPYSSPLHTHWSPALRPTNTNVDNQIHRRRSGSE